MKRVWLRRTVVVLEMGLPMPGILRDLYYLYLGGNAQNGTPFSRIPRLCILADSL